MRTVLRAQKQYNKKYGKFADSLNSLVHTGSFTKRMATHRSRRLQVGFKQKKDGFQLTMTPKQMDAQHRSFYAEDDGKIHAEEDKAATDFPGVEVGLETSRARLIFRKLCRLPSEIQSPEAFRRWDSAECEWKNRRQCSGIPIPMAKSACKFIHPRLHFMAVDGFPDHPPANACIDHADPG